MDHFSDGNVEIDMYLDADTGTLKLKRVDLGILINMKYILQESIIAHRIKMDGFSFYLL